MLKKIRRMLYSVIVKTHTRLAEFQSDYAALSKALEFAEGHYRKLSFEIL